MQGTITTRGLIVTVCMLCLCLSVLNGCSFNRGTVGDELKQENVDAIKKGVSTRTEVVTALGAPDRIIQANGHEIFQYYRYDIKAKGLFLLILNFSRINIKSDDLYIFLDKNGVVDEVVLGKRTDRLEFQFWPFGD
ncbi:MAG: outer membrane protein assembly factor BamE [Nitrospirae bacterium]|nr:outer membrane protein assembly factor BamE [Nitrospirota bacterium]